MATNRELAINGRRTESECVAPHGVNSSKWGRVGARPANRTDPRRKQSTEITARTQDPDLAEFEEELRKRLGGSEEQIFGWFFTAAYPHRVLYTEARRELNPNDAEEATQNVLSALFENHRRAKGAIRCWDTSRREGYWPSVFRRRMSNELRRRRARLKRERPLGAGVFAGLADPKQFTAVAMSDLMEAVDLLREPLRVVFTRHLADHTCTEIAAEVGIERHRVSRLLCVAKRELRRILSSSL